MILDGIKHYFFGLGADGTVGANKIRLKLLEKIQNFQRKDISFMILKIWSETVSHLRFGHEPIEAPYLISKQILSFVISLNF